VNTCSLCGGFRINSGHVCPKSTDIADTLRQSLARAQALEAENTELRAWLRELLAFKRGSMMDLVREDAYTQPLATEETGEDQDSLTPREE
jgi:hypothetical protein